MHERGESELRLCLLAGLIHRSNHALNLASTQADTQVAAAIDACAQHVDNAVASDAALASRVRERDREAREALELVQPGAPEAQPNPLLTNYEVPNSFDYFNGRASDMKNATTVPSSFITDQSTFGEMELSVGGGFNSLLAHLLSNPYSICPTMAGKTHALLIEAITHMLGKHLTHHVCCCSYQQGVPLHRR